MSPTAKTSGWPGSVRSGSTLIRPARSTSAPHASASLPASGDACTPAAQITVRAAMRSVVPSFRVTSTPSASTPVTRAPIRSSTPRSPSSRAAARDRLCPNVASGSSPPSTMITRIVVGSKVRKSPRSARNASSRTCPATSTPVGPAPTTTMVSHSRCSCASIAISAISNAPKMRRRSSSASSIVFMPGREQRELVVAEVRLVGAGGDDQAVVGNLHLVDAQPFGDDHPAIEVEPVDLGQLHLHVLVLAQDVAQRWCDLPGRQDAGGDLVEQRLEEVVVATVDRG